MAFSKTPAEHTYQTKRIRLIKELSNRGSDTSKDEDYVNLIPELIKNKNTKEDEILLIKRYGTEEFLASVAAQDVRGLFYWEKEDQLFVAVDNDIRIYNVATETLSTTLASAFTTTSGEVGFCEFLYDTGTVKVVATDGTTLQTIDSAGTRVAGADADQPIHIPYPVFLDGYLFIVEAGTADIWNSNLNDPLAYTAGDFITAEMLPDQVLWLSRLNNYLVVVGNQSIEYFWDAAIATGSPLQRNDTPVKLNGLIGGAATLGNTIFMVASKNSSQPDVFILEDFKMTPIGNEAIRRHLFGINTTSITSIRGALISMHGHNLYLLNTGTRTYIYDIESKLWTRWAYQAQEVFNFTHWVTAETPRGTTTFFSLKNDSAILNTNSGLYQDSGTNFPCVVVTANEEFGTYRQKAMSKLVVWADKPTASSTGTLQWSDNDYQSYNSGVAIDLYHSRPSVMRLGNFRKRAFKFTYTQNQPFRIEGFEVDLNMGQH